MRRVCTVCQCSCPGFTDNPLYTAFWRLRDKNSTAINNHYLDFVQTRGIILFVNVNRVDNNLKVNLVYVYLGSIVNNCPKNVSLVDREECSG